MDSATLGTLSFDKRQEYHKSKPFRVAALGNMECVFVFPDLFEREAVFPDEFDQAAKNFLQLPDGWLRNCSSYLWEYYRDMVALIGEEYIEPIDDNEDILTHISLESNIEIRWDCDENDVYISLGGSCDWEIEHGLQITLRHGNQLAKVSEYDGHVTNSDAYDRQELTDVIYVKRSGP